MKSIYFYPTWNIWRVRQKKIKSKKERNEKKVKNIPDKVKFENQPNTSLHRKESILRAELLYNECFIIGNFVFFFHHQTLHVNCQGCSICNNRKGLRRNGLSNGAWLYHKVQQMLRSSSYKLYDINDYRKYPFWKKNIEMKNKKIFHHCNAFIGLITKIRQRFE